MSKSGGTKVAQSPTDVAMGKQITDMNAMTDPLRARMLDVNGGPGSAIPALDKAFNTKLEAPDRENIEGQYTQAKNSMANQATDPYQLKKQMGDLALSRAQAVSSAANNAKQLGINRAMNIVPSILPSAAANMSAQSSIAGNEQQANMFKANQQAQNASQLSGGLGSLAGMALKVAMSSKIFKEDIEPYTDDVLKMVDETPIYTWRYIGDKRLHVGPVTEESPTIMVTEDGRALVEIDYLGFLFASIKALNKKVDELCCRVN